MPAQPKHPSGIEAKIEAALRSERDGNGARKCGVTVAAFDPFVATARWVRWRLEMRGGRLAKVPYCPAGGLAKADDPKTWDTREAAEAGTLTPVNGSDGGIGIVLGDLGDGTSLGGVDLDTCRLPDGTLEPWALKVIQKLNSYTEVSPSLTGEKIFFKYRTADLPLLRAEMGSSEHGKMFKRANGGADHPPAIELHLSNRYFAVTGQRLDSTPDEIVTVSTDALLWILQEAGPAFIGSGSKRSAKADSGEHQAKADHGERRAKADHGERQAKAAHGGTDQSRSGKAFAVACRARRENRTFDEMIEALRDNDETAEWLLEKGEPNNGRELRRLWKAAGAAVAVTLNDFHAYMPMHSYIFAPTRALWPAASVNALISRVKVGDSEIRASTWLDQNRHVEQMTWAPGLPEIIENRLLYEGGWLDQAGVRCFNQYRAPTIIPGDARSADRWLDHVQLLYPDDAEHLLDCFAHRVQRPQEKINHAIVLGGNPGIGKDTILEPVRHAIGPWNFGEESPSRMLGQFNPALKAVILRISEAHDLGEFDRFKFYDHMKAIIAAPPDTLKINEKFIREYLILNVCLIIITTNYRTDGIYLPSDDRRHYVTWSDLSKEDECFAGGYFDRLYAYFADGGNEAVAAYLAQRDIREFNPKAPPPKTAAFWATADNYRPAEESELTDVIDLMGRPNAFTLSTLIYTAETQSGGCNGGFIDWLRDRKNIKAIPHRLENCGYIKARNPDAKDGDWRIGGRRQTVYAQKSLSLRDQIAAAQGLQPRF
jgi:hypothetical protein